MTDDLYERYKEALRNGHIAVLRGNLPEAIDAYRFASEMAPSRALPHTSLGGVYIRLGYLDEALTEYAAAVARAPHDEGALLGQAEALLAADRRSEAALALDHVVEIQQAAGRLPEAADTLRRCVELEESLERGRLQRSLLREMRLSAGDRAAEQQLAKALRLREEPAEGTEALKAGPLRGGPLPGVALPSLPLGRRMASMGAHAGPAAAPQDAALRNAGSVVASTAELEPETKAVPTLELEPEQPVDGAIDAAIVEEAVAATAEIVAEVEAEAVVAAPTVAAVPTMVAVPAPAIEARLEPTPSQADAAPASAAAEPASTAEEREAVGVMAGLDEIAFPPSSGNGAGQPHQTGDELLAAAEAAEAAGDEVTLRTMLLWTARTYAREGRFEAGLDAAHRLLRLTPSDVDAHLALVELYVARHWDNLAADKLMLLSRIAELNDDVETHKRLCAVASRAFPSDQRLETICS
jgi:tetratricopeptide (TPR) repeat protein